MGTGRTNRLWVVGGAVGAIVLLAASWFLAISPQKAHATRLRGEADTAQQRLIPLQRRLVELRKQNTNLPQYRAQLARERKALPTVAGLSDFLRTLQSTGDQKGISVTGLIVGTPAKTGTGAETVYALPITVTAIGVAAKLVRFLDQLQQAQPRAVLIDGVNAAPEGQAGSLAGSVILTVNLHMFVADPDGSVPKPPPAK